MPTAPTLRDLYWCQYWMWELRDAYEDLAPLYERAWSYESRDGHLASEPRALPSRRAERDRDADAFYRATYDGTCARKTLPPFDDV